MKDASSLRLPSDASGCGHKGLGCVTEPSERAEKIKDAMRWSWKGYRETAWGHDEMGVIMSQKPASSTASSEATSGQPHPAAKPVDWMYIGLTPVDAMDTLLMMGLQEEYSEARAWVELGLDFNISDIPLSVFEVNIRVLGGLLSTFYLSGGDMVLLRKAVDLGERLVAAMNTSLGVAQVVADLSQKSDEREARVQRNNLAALGSFTMEMTTLTRITGRTEFASAAYTFWHMLPLFETCEGLYCIWLERDVTACSHHAQSGFGASSDSTYEYMLKQWAMSGKKDERMLTLYLRAMRGMRRHLLAPVSIKGDGRAGEELSSDPFWIVAEGEQLGYNVDVGEECGKGAGGPFFTAKKVWGKHWQGIQKLEQDLRASMRKDKAHLKLAINKRRDQKMDRDSTASGLRRERRKRLKAALKDLKNTAELAGHWILVNESRNGFWSSTNHSHPVSTQLFTISEASAAPSRTQTLLGTHSRKRSTIPADTSPFALNLQLQYFTCFVPGMLVLGYMLGVQTAASASRVGNTTSSSSTEDPSISSRAGGDLKKSSIQCSSITQDVSTASVQEEDDLLLAARLMPACYDVLYRASPTGVSPDVLDFIAEDQTILYHSERSSKKNKRQGHGVLPAASEKKGNLVQLSSTGANTTPAARSSPACSHWPSGCKDAGAENDLHQSTLMRHDLESAAGHTSVRRKQIVAKMVVKDSANYLRPEVVESMFYLWRATGHQVYREWGWAIFMAFEQHSRVETGGYSRLINYSSLDPVRGDRMESFWLAETLKYFYLLFTDDQLVTPLDQFIFNTEAHPLPVWGSTAEDIVLKRLGIKAHNFDPWSIRE
ncbi:hypothetical protein CEUSTIGMA_g9970.t1 [Chlamydomonas eustigma]|uniref:alpha-1,2-Mannosidase n=1 Tax=Chlamydomonas eustigma TaxID=1157962 RepID=A0A250XHM5_9CHLO|nr:hypothetical protein CEUSTIGMA_g9970.t1 [Chlamydomonas eustigma]|eukprot:GAX82543.1 hypothetical protein CEUSTIGMA_g9970.t1 [Chlamydomonas eustigma]